MNKVKPLKVTGASFICTPHRRKMRAGKLFVFDTEGEFLVHVSGYNESIVFTIPEGFICDSTSLPWAMDSAGDAHDYGYCMQGENAKGYDKLFWDDVFYYLMLDIGMPKWRAKLRHRGVRMFGDRAYKKRYLEKCHFSKMEKVGSTMKEWGM